MIEQGSALFGPGPEEPSRADGMRPRRPGGAPPVRWRIELAGGGTGGRSEVVHVTVIDADTGKRIGRKALPFDWFRDIGHCGTVVVEIDAGEWS